MSGTERDDAEGLATLLLDGIRDAMPFPTSTDEWITVTRVVRSILARKLPQHDAAVAAQALREFGEDCGRSIEAMATASQYGPHRRAGMRDAAARVRQRANEFADDIESEGRR